MIGDNRLQLKKTGEEKSKTLITENNPVEKKTKWKKTN